MHSRAMAMKNPRGRGFTLLEMLTTLTVLLILASAVVPMAKNGVRRQKELELRRSLREMRVAIDTYKSMVDQQKIKAPSLENNGYPESLDELVEGAPMMGKTIKMRFLRRIPVDPFLGKAEWGLRSVSDEPDSTSWGGGSVFDVYSLAPGTGMNGISYREW
jgi:general secretion pathway protein G